MGRVAKCVWNIARIWHAEGLIFSLVWGRHETKFTLSRVQPRHGRKPGEVSNKLGRAAIFSTNRSLCCCVVTWLEMLWDWFHWPSKPMSSCLRRFELSCQYICCLGVLARISVSWMRNSELLYIATFKVNFSVLGKSLMRGSRKTHCLLLAQGISTKVLLFVSCLYWMQTGYTSRVVCWAHAHARLGLSK